MNGDNAFCHLAGMLCMRRYAPTFKSFVGLSAHVFAKGTYYFPTTVESHLWPLLFSLSKFMGEVNHFKIK